MVGLRYLLCVLTLIPMSCIAQFVGVSGQWVKFDSDSKFQLNTSLSAPYFYKEKGDKLFLLSGGVEYQSGKTPVSGLNIKPVSFSFVPAEYFLDSPFLLTIGAETGYNFNFKNHNKDGIILTPYLYADCIFLYLKAGYDYNAFENEGQFFIRVGTGLTWGSIRLLIFRGHRRRPVASL